MSQPVGFNLQINESPENGAMCDICTTFIVSGDKRISTFIGTSPQSNVCVACADDVTDAVLATRKPKRQTVAA